MDCSFAPLAKKRVAFNSIPSGKRIQTTRVRCSFMLDRVWYRRVAATARKEPLQFVSYCYSGSEVNIPPQTMRFDIIILAIVLLPL